MESRHGTEVILRSSWTNIKSCCPGTFGIQDEWHHCVSSKGPTCAAQPPQPPWLPSWSPHSLHRPKLALLVLCLFSRQLVYVPGISNLLGSPWHFFFYFGLTSPCSAFWGFPQASYPHILFGLWFFLWYLSESLHDSISLFAFYIQAKPALHGQHSICHQPYQ